MNVCFIKIIHDSDYYNSKTLLYEQTCNYLPKVIINFLEANVIVNNNVAEVNDKGQTYPSIVPICLKVNGMVAQIEGIIPRKLCILLATEATNNHPWHGERNKRA